MLRRRDLPLPLLALLAGCGGGGGGDTPPPPPAPPQGLDLRLTPAHASDGLDGTVTLRAEGGAAVAQVQFQLDGVDLGPPVGAPPFTRTLDTTAHASGQHVLSARARSAAGQPGDATISVVRFGGGRAVPAGWGLDEAWLQGLDSATAFTRTPDGRFLVAEQGGALRVVKQGRLLPAPMLARTVDASGERGLIGVTVHPQFAANGRVYVHYTRIDGAARHNRIARFTAAGDGVAGDEEVVFDLPALSSATNHNGGGMAFGGDGRLFIGVGDNARGAWSQDPASPLGKLLRLDEDLRIPADNPGAGSPVWASGLRNPFTLAVQPGTGVLHVNDVGQGAWEEIDLGRAGANYGWPDSEGPDRVGPGIDAPRFAYGHADAVPPGSGPGGFFTGAAIAGGAFVPDTDAWPASLRGRYLFADLVAGFVGVLDPATGQAHQFARVSGNPVGLWAGDDVAVYVLTRDAIVRIAPT